MPPLRASSSPRFVALGLAAAAFVATAAAAEQCCATCLAQSDPKTRNITYDPLVFAQCSAARGICCYGCAFAHGAPAFTGGVAFASDGAAQTTAGTRVTLSLNGVQRLTYDFLATNQIKSTFVGNLSTQVLPGRDGSFALCARAAGTIALRGWGADACRQVTPEYTIAVLASGDGTASCDTSGAATVKPGGGDDSGDDATKEPTQPVAPQGDGSAKTGADDVDNCSATRGSVKTSTAGNKFCECVGDWRNPPLCDEYSWTKTIVTILGAVAAVLSIAFSVRAYVKSKKAEREARGKELDVASENELETMRISPAKRDNSSNSSGGGGGHAGSPATTVSLHSTKRSPAQTPLTSTPIRTSGHETTL